MGKTYIKTTNKKGIAQLKIKNKYKHGKYRVKIKYAKEILKKTITIK